MHARKYSSSMLDVPSKTTEIKTWLSESTSRLTEEAADWAREHPKTTIALGIAATAGLGCKFVLPRVLDHRLGTRLLADAAEATKLAPGTELQASANGYVAWGGSGKWSCVSDKMVKVDLSDGTNLVAGANGMVRTYSNGSKVWFSTERQRFGLKLADQADGTDKFGQKLSKMVELGNHRNDFGFLRSSSLRNGVLEATRTERYHDLLLKAPTEEILPQIPLGTRHLNAGGEALVLKTTKGTALRIQPLGHRERLADPDMLESIKTHRGLNWQVEELSLTSSKNIKQAEMDAAANRVRSRGYVVWDEKAENFGRLPNGRVVFVDPGCILRRL